jgi:hypothetical protein
VVGEKIEPLNMLISTLALFLSPTERQLSRYAVDVADMPDLVYESDLFLQGLLLKPVSPVDIFELVYGYSYTVCR